MTQPKTGPPEEVPIIGMDAPLMVFPGVTAFAENQDPDELVHFFGSLGIDPASPWAILAMVNRKITSLPEAFYKVGVVSSVDVDPEAGTMKFKGLHRAEILDRKRVFHDLDGKKGHWMATVKYFHDENCDEYFINNEVAIRGSFMIIRKLLQNYANEIYPIHNDIGNLIGVVSAMRKCDFKDKDAVDQIIWATLYHMPPEVGEDEKQPFLESNSLIERIELLRKLLDKHLMLVLHARGDVESLSRRSRNKLTGGKDSKPKSNEDPDQDQDAEIDSNPSNLNDAAIARVHPDIQKRWRKFKSQKDALNLEAQKAILEDFARLVAMGAPGHTEWTVFLNHLDTLLDWPWGIATPQETDIVKVETSLEKSHYGLNKIKDRISNNLAARTLNPKGRAMILCFVGPPGVGKTSIGKSIAESQGRKFIRLSLGGIRDEAEIRGHRRTYIGALPGKIVKEIIRIGVNNPVFMLDEVDKIGTDFRGDPASALLEVLDPEQNSSFNDHYVDTPLDLSNVLFLCTANLASGIQPPLLDRMSVIPLSGYTEEEKIQIAKRFLIPKLVEKVGFAQHNVEIEWQNGDPDTVISGIITGYTREAGVRKLEQCIQEVFENLARGYLKSEIKPSKMLVTSEFIEKCLGLPKYLRERVAATVPGEAVGLAWTLVGGEIIYVHAQLTPRVQGDKSLSQTGSSGDVMLRSNKTALTVAKNLVELIDPGALKKLETHMLHLQANDAATPTDGPSATITMAMAICSELTQKPIKPFLAFTGELTPKGKICAVGGIKEKILAAHREGVREVVLPEANRRDVIQDVSEEIKKVVTFHFVKHAREVLSIAFPSPA